MESVGLKQRNSFKNKTNEAQKPILGLIDPNNKLLSIHVNQPKLVSADVEVPGLQGLLRENLLKLNTTL